MRSDVRAFGGRSGLPTQKARIIIHTVYHLAAHNLAPFGSAVALLRGTYFFAIGILVSSYLGDNKLFICCIIVLATKTLRLMLASAPLNFTKSNFAYPMYHL